MVDNEWRQDELPFDHITVPSEELPDPEADNSDPLLTMSEQVNEIDTDTKCLSFGLKITILFECRNKSGMIWL